MAIGAAGAARIPHTRGGEPVSSSPAAIRAIVFPTRVGVNRHIVGQAGRPQEYSPHAWG